ncbi:MAG: MFS transporter [Saprospiraceae bacterium]
MLARLLHYLIATYSGIPRDIWFLSAVSLVNRAGSMVVVFITLYLTGQLGYTVKEAGYVMGFFGAGALVGALLGGRLTDRFGYFWIQFWSLALHGIILIGIVWVRDFWHMCVAIFVMTVVSELFRPANSVAIARHATPETRTRSISLYRMAVNLGWSIAPPQGGARVLGGWGWGLWVDGVTCMLAALLLWRLLPPAKQKYAPEPVRLEADAPASAPQGSIWADREYLIFLGLTILNAIIFMQFIWTTPLFFKQIYHWDETVIGLVSALNGLLVLAVEMPLVYRIDGKRHNMRFIRTGLVLYGLSYAALSLPLVGMLPALMFIALISLGEIYVMPFSANYVFTRSKGARQGRYMGLYTVSYSVANIIAPLAGSQIIEHFGFNVLWLAMSAMSAVSFVGFYFLEKKMPAMALSLPVQKALPAD